MKQKFLKNIEKEVLSLNENQSGAIGYILAWLLGVPATLLFVIFLIRG